MTWGAGVEHGPDRSLGHVAKLLVLAALGLSISVRVGESTLPTDVLGAIAAVRAFGLLRAVPWPIGARRHDCRAWLWRLAIAQLVLVVCLHMEFDPAPARFAAAWIPLVGVVLLARLMADRFRMEGRKAAAACWHATRVLAYWVYGPVLALVTLLALAGGVGPAEGVLDSPVGLLGLAPLAALLVALGHTARLDYPLRRAADESLAARTVKRALRSAG